MGKLKFAKGIYTNWLEIQAGNPSYKENFLADSVSIEQEVLSNGQSGKLILQKTDGQTLPSTIAAVCTGWGIYIRTKVGDKSYGLRRLLNDGPIWFMLAHTHHNGLGNRFNEVGTSIGANGKTVLSNQERHLVEQNPKSFYHPRPLIYDPRVVRMSFLEKRGQMINLLKADNELLALFEHEPQPRTDVERLTPYRRYINSLNEFLTNVKQAKSTHSSIP